MPRRAAAPFGPLMVQLVSRSVPRMCSRSASSIVVGLRSRRDSLQRLRFALEFPDRRIESCPLCENDGAFDEVFELPDVAGPAIPHHGVHGFFGNRFDPLVHAPRQFLGEVPNQQGNIFDAFAQRRRDDGKNVETIEQIAAKLPIGHHFVEIAIGCRHEPDIRPDCSSRCRGVRTPVPEERAAVWVAAPEEYRPTSSRNSVPPSASSNRPIF